MNYQEYKTAQITRAESKWARKWDYDEIFKQQLNLTIDDVNEFISPTEICCMGCRSGSEVFEFKERFPKAKVYGVDITKNIDTIRTHLDVKILLEDFNHLPTEWENKFDLIFSNSLDHAYQPAKTLVEWWRVSQPKGKLLLEFSTTDANNIEHSFNMEQVDRLFPKDKFKTVTVWDSPDRHIFTGLFEAIK